MEQGNLPGSQKEKAPGVNETKSENERKLEQQKVTGKNDTDTEPDEFIAPNADTDTPLDGKGIVNDAVLGGEDHTSEKFENEPEKGKQ
jgi:hypothetical protein